MSLPTSGDRFDFGVVAPGSILEHQFRVRNDTSEPWELASVKTTCGCTTVKPASQTILPQQSLSIPVKLNTGRVPKRHVQRVILRFQGDVDPKVFTISAVVRKPVTVFPDDCSFSVAHGRSDKHSLTVENYSSFRWNEVQVRTTSVQEWLAASLDDPGSPCNSNSQRQRFTVSVNVDATELRPGNYLGEINVVALGADGSTENEVIPVQLRVLPDMRVTPSSLLVLAASVGNVIKKVVIRSTDGFKPGCAEEMKLYHQLPVQIGLQCEQLNDNTLIATFTFSGLDGTHGTLRDELTLRSRSSPERVFSLPVVLVGN